MSDEPVRSTKSQTTATKVCNSCAVEKPLADFHRRSDDPDGRQVRSECIECERSRHKREYQDRRQGVNPDELNPVGRPTRDTEYVRSVIMQELSVGKLLTQVIRENPEMPTYETLMKWWLGHPGDGHDKFRSSLVQARQAQIEKWLEEAWAELQDPRDDWVWHEKRKEFVPDKFAPMRLKELLQHTRWMAERVLPTLYGSRVQVDHSHTRDSQAAPRIDWSKLDAETIRKVRAAMIDPDAGGHEEPPRLVGQGSSDDTQEGEVIEQKDPGS